MHRPKGRCQSKVGNVRVRAMRASLLTARSLSRCQTGWYLLDGLAKAPAPIRDEWRSCSKHFRVNVAATTSSITGE